MPDPLTRDEAVVLVRRLMSADHTDAEADAWLATLGRDLVCPHVADLIYWHDLTAEDVVDRALAYKPIALGP